MAAARGSGAWAGGWAGVWAWAGLALGLGLGLGLGPGPAAAGQVPLIAWSTESALWPPPSERPGGRVVSAEQLWDLLGPALSRGPRTLLLFQLEQLSLEDFTAYGGVYGNKPDGAFPNLQGALEAAASRLVLPAVAGGALGGLGGGLGRALGAAPLRVDPPALRRLRLDPHTPGVLLGEPPALGSSFMAPREVLTSNDEALGQLLSALAEQDVPHTVLVTARRPARPPRAASVPPPVGPGRSLLGREEGGGPAEPPPAAPLRWPPAGPPRLLLWGRNLTVAYKGQRRDLTPRAWGGPADVDVGGSSWDPQEARLVLRFNDVFGATLNITLVLRQAWFPVSGRPWAWLAELGVSLGGAPPATFSGTGGAAAPTPLGWRCGELGAPGPFLLPRDPPDPAHHWQLLLRDVQIQGFNVSGVSFGGASDCAGFFSGGAWMGLLSAGGLLAALALGGGLLLRLRPMDRFDDPRGPPLPVPPGE